MDDVVKHKWTKILHKLYKSSNSNLCSICNYVCVTLLLYMYAEILMNMHVKSCSQQNVSGNFITLIIFWIVSNVNIPYSLKF